MTEAHLTLHGAAGANVSGHTLTAYRIGLRGLLEAWTLPKGVLERFEDMSNSGGSWEPDGRLYLTGHDPAKAYVMELPEAGSVELEIAGQGIAWDRNRPDVLYGIIRGEDDEPNRVTVSRISVRTAQE